MKNVLILVVFFASSSALALGGFDCKTSDGLTKIVGNSGSAGTWISEVTIDGKKLREKTEFTAEALYVGNSSFNFAIMDGDYNKTLLVVETVKKYSSTSG